MSAVFEINLIYRGTNEVINLFNSLKKSEIEYTIDSIELMDDWDYNNHHLIELNGIKDFINLLSKKILIINGTIKRNYSFGISVRLLEQDIFEINFWLSTNGLEELDSDYITKDNASLYESITTQLINQANLNSLIACALGSELFMESNIKIEKMISSSKNVCEWIFPNIKESFLLEKYDKKAVNGFIIYKLYQSES